MSQRLKVSSQICKHSIIHNFIFSHKKPSSNKILPKKQPSKLKIKKAEETPLSMYDNLMDVKPINDNDELNDSLNNQNNTNEGKIFDQF